MKNDNRVLLMFWLVVAIVLNHQGGNGSLVLDVWAALLVWNIRSIG